MTVPTKNGAWDVATYTRLLWLLSLVVVVVVVSLSSMTVWWLETVDIISIVRPRQ